MKLRLGMVAVLAALATLATGAYCRPASDDAVTGARQSVALSVQEEVALGRRTHAKGRGSDEAK